MWVWFLPARVCALSYIRVTPRGVATWISQPDSTLTIHKEVTVDYYCACLISDQQMAVGTMIGRHFEMLHYLRVMKHFVHNNKSFTLFTL